MQLPEDFISLMRATMGEARCERLLLALQEEPPVSVRVNPRKPPADAIALEKVPWCSGGYYLSARPNFTFDPLLHAGAYYVQEASSMFIDRVLRQWVQQPVRMLDLCAAPGGKSTAARAALPPGSLLLSNDPVRQRAQILAENIQKWGYEDCLVSCNYPRDIRRSGLLFDIILCDAPCSGEGMFRKDEGAVGEWSLQNVEKCWRMQRDIVAEAWQCLLPGGLLIYSTCTFNTKENEENVQWMCSELGAEVLPVATEAEWGITGSLLAGFNQPVSRFIPGYSRGEGLFMAVLRKGRQHEEHAPLRWNSRALSRLNMVYDGLPALLRKGKELVPRHAEALSTALEKGKYPQAELTYAQAIGYLRREAIVLPAGTPRGFVIVTFCGLPLGFVKNIGNRANNLYPQEWRIKSTHTPTEYEAILRHP